MDRFLVIGGDGLIGRALASHLISCGFTVDATSRRRQSNVVQFDLSKPDFDVLDGYSHIFICAGVTNISACDNEPDFTYKINVESTASIAKYAAKGGSYLYYISSNTVFDGTTPFPDEGCNTSPITEYGKQKVAIESILLSLPTASVIRVTKILSQQVPLFGKFLSDLKAGNVVTPFCDLNLTPMSLSYLCESVYRLVKSKKTGLFHLSGEEDLTYSQLCFHLAGLMGVSKNLVQPVNRDSVIYNPKYSGLGMNDTRKITGIRPETTQQALVNILAENA